MTTTTPTPDAAASPGRAARLAGPCRALVNAPGRLVVAILAIWVGCSMVYAVLEDKGPIESLWWGVVTGSTVGYGDFYPASTAGRGVAVVLIIAMLVLVPIAIGHVIAALVLDRNEFTHTEQVALAEAISSVHDRVDTVEHLLLASLAEKHGRPWVEARLTELAASGRTTSGADDRMLELFRATTDD